MTWQQFKEWLKRITDKLRNGESGAVEVPA